MPYRTLSLAHRVLRPMETYLWAGLVNTNTWMISPTMLVGGSIISAALSANVLYAIPFCLPLGGHVVRTQIRCTTLAAGALARVGLYSSLTLRDIYPDRLLRAFTEFDLSTTGRKADTVEYDLMGGVLYWLAYLTNNATAQIRLIPTTEARGISHVLANLSSDLTTLPVGLRVTQTYGALPDPFPSGADLASESMPLIALQPKR